MFNEDFPNQLNHSKDDTLAPRSKHSQQKAKLSKQETHFLGGGCPFFKALAFLQHQPSELTFNL